MTLRSSNGRPYTYVVDQTQINASYVGRIDYQLTPEQWHSTAGDIRLDLVPSEKDNQYINKYLNVYMYGECNLSYHYSFGTIKLGFARAISYTTLKDAEDSLNAATMNGYRPLSHGAFKATE